MIRNSNFSEASIQPGNAAHWRLRSHVSGVQIAPYGPSPHAGAENFEGWSKHQSSLGVLVQAFWRPLNMGAEAFAAGWQNDAFLVAWPSGRFTQALFDREDAEDFQWTQLRRVWSQISNRVGIVELFERAWQTDKIFTFWSTVPSRPATAFPETFDDVAWPSL